MSIAFLYPGQGAQHVGMGRDLYESSGAARRVFELAEEAAELPIRRLCFEGPEDQLSRTDVGQPAIFAVSAAAMAAMDELLGDDGMAEIAPSQVAGLSLGEYTALYAADAIDLQPAVRLVTRRGQLMQQAATATPSGMLCVMGLDEGGAEKLVAAAAGSEPLTCANFNCPGQIVLSGSLDACNRAEQLAREFGASGAAPLKVAGAFHSELMAPAADRLAEALDEVTFRAPRVPVVSNVDGLPYTEAAEIPRKLLAQLTAPVRWQQSMEWMLAAGVRTLYEIGPGRVLAGLMRRIDRSMKVTCLNGVEAIRKLGEAPQPPAEPEVSYV
jgi:[acyl-carrier-protein] S-malonyltransferase